ncbi:uncharacterized protein BO66DRAFT_389353 [Aspergillus aculeatinus CBS 121060]|uniref:K+ channel tetramerization domain-containing protein n=1 Tax=Aspergillus aculeatinus CBS 121060 TaxID=1448322 RepID=A0ACD1HIG4_9EURO|nr:K+ channel tetramerization domain-containing protein [Aspergillus aculeatinus CBS 121060]RAH73234.1 K+ channel tetramerization domain-containing protein [Aspergillus aculeatinus CBS 121060]
MSSDSGRAMISPSMRRSPKSNLPPERVFSIQIGTELFRLSGASIASDAPSYFSHFFEEQIRQNGDNPNIRTLYIDRDPTTFKEIAKHLQGYHIQPTDGSQFVKFFADAQFYSLPRLISQLFESQIFIQIGDRNFQIPRDIFSGPGDSPNFFTLGFAAFFASPVEVFPGLERHGLLRPPAITPPSVPNRSGEVFAQLLHLLRGYPLRIRNEEHRAELLRDCRYFHLRGLEQKIIPHHISFNPILGRDEIIIRLEDVRRSGVHLEQGANACDSSWVRYSRPFLDEKKYDLIVEIGDESTILDLTTKHPTFLNLTKSRVTSLLQIVASKKLAELDDVAIQDEQIWFVMGPDTSLTVDGEQTSYRDVVGYSTPGAADSSSQETPNKRRRVEEPSNSRVWVVRNGQWRICVRPSVNQGSLDFLLRAVQLDVYTQETVRNRSRPFLGSSAIA